MNIARRQKMYYQTYLNSSVSRLYENLEITFPSKIIWVIKQKKYLLLLLGSYTSNKTASLQSVSPLTLPSTLLLCAAPPVPQAWVSHCLFFFCNYYRILFSVYYYSVTNRWEFWDKSSEEGHLNFPFNQTVLGKREILVTLSPLLISNSFKTNNKKNPTHKKTTHKKKSIKKSQNKAKQETLQF